jgi:hypothetical protein
MNNQTPMLQCALCLFCALVAIVLLRDWIAFESESPQRYTSEDILVQ